MSIQSIEVEATKEINYPKLMKCKNLIVLMTSHGCGMTMNKRDARRVGEYSDAWSMENFKDYNGEVKLKNK